ncbi:MAG: class I SAM-dependent methyltransferase [Ilumatobacter sp.]
MTQNDQGLAAAVESTPAQIEALYDAWVTDYERDVLSWGYDAPTVSAGRLAQLVVPASAHVLDAGCGTGLTGVALAAAGFTRLTGIDLSADSLEHAERRDVYATTRQVDLTAELPFDDDEFGGLLCCGVLSYLPDVGSVLGEFVRVVEPGGSVVFTQRTDLWVGRDTQQAIDGLVAARRCTADVSGPKPYLPKNPEFTDSLGIRYVALTVTA